MVRPNYSTTDDNTLLRSITTTTMPSEYASASGGALRMKGAKVEKHKKKKKDKKEKRERRAAEASKDIDSKDKDQEKDVKDAKEDDDPYARMTPAERRFAEAQDKKVCTLMSIIENKLTCRSAR